MNRVEISGRLSRDPDLRMVGNGFPICGLNVAVEDAEGRWNRDTKKTEVDSGFYQVEIIGDYGKWLAETLSRGDRVHVVGSLSQWRMRPKNEGEEGDTKTRIKATVVTLLGVPRETRPGILAPSLPLADDGPDDPWATLGWSRG